jgi:3-phenylpropionate/trans-cinnamate dioxygenase ferredoxin subunit/naphthalene 1,2-dioxygenase system ferredoxin subunit
VVECPLHGAQFDVITGKAMSAPADGDIETYEVTVADGRVFVGSAQLAPEKG